MKVLWIISLAVFAAATIFLGIANITQAGVNEWLVRAAGILDLVALGVLVFTTVRMRVKK